jgi:hypothetical protein
MKTKLWNVKLFFSRVVVVAGKRKRLFFVVSRTVGFFETVLTDRKEYNVRLVGTKPA